MKNNFHHSLKSKLITFFKKLWHTITLIFSILFVIVLLVAVVWIFNHSTNKQIESETKIKKQERFVIYDESNEIVLDLVRGCLYSKNYGLIAKNETEFDCDKSYIEEYTKR